MTRWFPSAQALGETAVETPLAKAAARKPPRRVIPPEGLALRKEQARALLCAGAEVTRASSNVLTSSVTGGCAA